MADRQTNRSRNNLIRQTNRQIYQQIERQADRQADRLTSRQIDKQIDRQAERQISRQIDKQIDRLADRQNRHHTPTQYTFGVRQFKRTSSSTIFGIDELWRYSSEGLEYRGTKDSSKPCLRCDARIRNQSFLHVFGIYWQRKTEHVIEMDNIKKEPQSTNRPPVNLLFSIYNIVYNTVSETLFLVFNFECHQTRYEIAYYFVCSKLFKNIKVGSGSEFLKPDPRIWIRIRTKMRPDLQHCYI